MKILRKNMPYALTAFIAVNELGVESGLSPVVFTIPSSPQQVFAAGGAPAVAKGEGTGQNQPNRVSGAEGNDVGR
jgi:hypothetical protein